MHESSGYTLQKIKEAQEALSNTWEKGCYFNDDMVKIETALALSQNQILHLEQLHKDMWNFTKENFK